MHIPVACLMNGVLKGSDVHLSIYVTASDKNRLNESAPDTRANE